MRRFVAVVTTAAWVAAACGGSPPSESAGSGPAPTTTTSVGVDGGVEFEVQDEERSRTIDVLVHRPLGDGPFPIIVLAHGLGGNGRSFKEFGAWLAQRGYVAVMPTFPITSGGQWEQAADVNNQPADVTIVLDHVVDRLGSIVDPERIGVVGHSLGGVTALLAGFHACCRDDRVDAVAVWAGGALFGGDEGEYFEVGIGTPVLFVHGDADAVLRFSLGRSAFAAASKPKWFITLVEGDHVVAFFLDGRHLGVVREGTLAFLDAYVKEDRDAVTRLGGIADDPEVATVESVG